MATRRPTNAAAGLVGIARASGDVTVDAAGPSAALAARRQRHDTPRPPRCTLELLGRSVGNYILVEQLGSGSMGAVFRAEHPQIKRQVAVKVIRGRHALKRGAAERFVAEARAIARIQHPNVVPTLDVVALEDELFLVMEYVQGEALSKLIRAARRRQETMPPPVALSIMAGALHGLHAAHEAKSERGTPLNIVHRDISPQNILVGTDGVARVLDFGVAKAAMRATSTTIPTYEELIRIPDEACRIDHTFTLLSDDRLGRVSVGVTLPGGERLSDPVVTLVSLHSGERAVTRRSSGSGRAGCR